MSKSLYSILDNILFNLSARFLAYIRYNSSRYIYTMETMAHLHTILLTHIQLKVPGNEALEIHSVVCCILR